MKFKYSSADHTQGNDLLNNCFGHNYARWHKDFKCYFACQYLRKPIPSRKLYPNRKLYPFLNHILSVFYFSWLVGCALYVDEKMIVFIFRHVDKMIISNNNKGDGFQADYICNWRYTYAFLSRYLAVPK